ncbi:MAG: hypothetical protein WA628_17300 [Terriglobales bacterium]
MAPDESTGAKRAPAKPNESRSPAVRNQPEDLKNVAADSALNEDVALSLLKRPDVSPDVLEQLAKNGSVLKSRKVKLALVEHPKTPRHVSLPLVRQLYTFDLMQVALTPVVPADIKLAADEALCNRMETLSSGERLALAHRGSGRIAGALLLDAEARVVQAALQNSRLTESSIIRGLTGHDASAAFVEAVSHHPQWSLRREVRVALLRNEKTPMACAVEFARTIPAAQVRDILHTSRLPGNIKAYLLRDLEKRASGPSLA